MKAKDKHKHSGVLIADCTGIGDIVINLPLYAAVRTLFPDEVITLLCHSWAEQLLRYTGFVDNHVAVKVPWGHGEGEYLSPSMIKTFLTTWRQRGRNQLGIEFSGDFRNKFLLWLSRAPRRVGLSYAGITSGPMSDLIFSRYFPGDGLLTTPISIHNNWAHISAQRALSIDYLGYKNALLQPKLKVTQKELEAAYRQLPYHNKAVLVHPGAGSSLRLWPVENYEVLIKGLRGRGYAPVLIGVPAEKKLIKAIVDLTGNPQIPVIYPSIRDFLALVAASRCIVCMDSAAAHIAGNIGTPAVVLYGPQSRALWHPFGGPLVLLRNDVCSEHPCNGRKCSLGLPTPCMSSITSTQVLEGFDRIMHDNQ